MQGPTPDTQISSEPTREPIVERVIKQAQQTSRAEEIVLALLLVAAVILAVYFRFVGLNWDDNQHLHPDERFLTMVETSIAPVKSLREFFDSAKSSLNPVNRGHNFFVYGTLPIFVVRYVGEWLKQTGYDEITLVGRQLSALADLGALLFLFMMAKRLYGDRVAVISALLSAAAVLPIQQSHFFTVDTFANLFVVAAFYFILRASREGAGWQFALAGLSVGMAVACKSSVLSMTAFEFVSGKPMAGFCGAVPIARTALESTNPATPSKRAINHDRTCFINRFHPMGCCSACFPAGASVTPYRRLQAAANPRCGRTVRHRCGC